MISEHSRTEIKGEWFIAVLEDQTCHLTLAPREASHDGLTPKQMAKVLDEMENEIVLIKERIADLGCLPKINGLIARSQTPPSLPVYSDIIATTSNHAREISYKRFYADEDNEHLTLHVTNCKIVAKRSDTESMYEVSGYTTPRQAPLRGTLKAKKEVPA